MITIEIWWLVALAWVYGANARRMQGSHGTRVMGYMLYALLVAPMALVLGWVGAAAALLTALQFVWPGRDFAKWYSLAGAHAATMVPLAALLWWAGPWWSALPPLAVAAWAPLCYLPPQAPLRERLLGAGGVGLPWVGVVLSAGSTGA